MITPEARQSRLDDNGVLTLGLWLSPAFPVGGFTYSHGLEWAIEDGSVTSAQALQAWLGDILRHGAGRNDAILFAQSWQAVVEDDFDRLGDILELADAFQPTRERRLEATAQGAAFHKAIADIWPSPTLDRALTVLSQRFAPIPWTYPVAVGVAAASHGLAVRPSLAAYLQAFTATVVSAGVRIIPLGQTDGLRVVTALAPLCLTIADKALQASLDDLGGAALRADLASMHHETQYTRLFRS